MWLKVVSIIGGLGVLQASSTLQWIDSSMSEVVESVDCRQVREVFWEDLCKDVRWYILAFASKGTLLKMSAVCKEFDEISNRRCCQRILARGKEQGVDEEVMVALKQGDFDAMMWVLEHHPLLKQSFFRYSSLSNFGWGIAFTKLYPRLFTAYMYDHPRCASLWGKYLDDKGTVDFYKACVQYDDRGIKDWMYQVKISSLGPSLWTLLQCMRIKMYPWLVNIFGSHVLSKKRFERRDILALRGILAGLYHHKKLYSFFVEEERVSSYALQKLCFNMIRANEDLLLKDLLCHLFYKHKTEKSLVLQQDLEMNLNFIIDNKISIDEFYSSATLDIMQGLDVTTTILFLPLLATSFWG